MKLLQTFLIVFLLLFAVACNDEEDPPPDIVLPDNTTTSNNVDQLVVEGEVEPAQHIDLSFVIGGQVANILIEEGESVTAGQPLVELDKRLAETAVSRTQLALDQATNELEAANTNLLLAQESVTAAEQAVLLAQTQLELLQTAPISEQIRLIESNIAIANAQISEAQGNQALILQGPTTADIRAAQALLQEAIAQSLPASNAYNLLQWQDIGDSEDEERAQILLNAAQANVNAAEANLAQIQAGSTPAQRQAATALVLVAQAQREVAQAQLNLLMAGPKAERLALAQLILQKREAQQQVALAQVAMAEAVITQVEAAILKAEVAHQEAQTRLQQMTLLAPFNGTVTSLNLEVGDIVQANAPVAVLADLSSWIVTTTDLTEFDVIFLTEGGSIGMTFDAFPNTRVNGTIEHISLVHHVEQGDVLYDATIALEDTTGLNLKWGMTAALDIETSE